MAKTLHLMLTYHWWDKVLSGEKKAEYRRFTANWRKRLADVRPGDLVVFHRGYTNRTLTRRIEQIRVIGGPVDVAVISKHDGFIWLKRKLYFNPELNHCFFNKYMK